MSFNVISENEILAKISVFTVNTMDHPDLIACSFMENSIGLKMVQHTCKFENQNDN